MLAVRQIVQEGLKPPMIIFVQSKERAASLFRELVYDGLNVDVIHAERTQTQVRMKEERKERWKERRQEVVFKRGDHSYTAISGTDLQHNLKQFSSSPTKASLTHHHSIRILTYYHMFSAFSLMSPYPYILLCPPA